MAPRIRVPHLLQHLIKGALTATVILAVWIVLYLLDAGEGDSSPLELAGMWTFIVISALLWLAVWILMMRQHRK